METGKGTHETGDGRQEAGDRRQERGSLTSYPKNLALIIQG